MARKATRRKSVKTKAKSATKHPTKKVAKKATKKATKKAVREVAAKAKKVAKRKSVARRRTRKIAGTYETAMATLTHYIEQGGKNLSEAGRSTLEAAREVIHDVSTKISKSTA
ncbi:MAG: hypothetical protein K0Q70_2210 [Rhodospirillales bacterium]|jgi:hypothetical protein|nr:hypothetical protein [Rhodospirillales bacterium]